MTHPDIPISLRVFMTGFRGALSEFCEALARQPGIMFLGAARTVAEAERTLTAGDVDVVIQAAEGPLPRGELAAIRERTRTPVVLVVERPDPLLFEDALLADLADVIVLPEPAERVAFTLRKVARIAARQGLGGEDPRAHLVTVFSPKGGTGKTVVASNLSATFAKHRGLRTLLVDLDLQFGDAAIMLGMTPEQTLHDLVVAGGELDPEKFRGYLTRHSPSCLDLLAAPLRPQEGEQITDDNIERLLSVAQLMYDVVVVDTSPFFHGPMLSTLDHTNDLLIVCSPEVPALKNVRLGIETLRLLGFPQDKLRVCLNRADGAVGVRRPEVESVLGLEVSFELPNAPEVPAAVNQGTPLVLASPGHDFSQAVQSMSQSLVGARRADAAASDGADDHGALIGTVRGLASRWLPSREEKQQASSKYATDPADGAA